MKMAGLIIGILFIVLGFIGTIVCLLLPSMTNGRVNMEEAALGLIPAILVLLLGFLIAAVAGILVIKGRKKATA